MPARETVASRARARADAVSILFAREVRDARLALGKSQHDAAREAGVDRSDWSRMERGEKRDITLPSAVRIAAAVGLDLSMKCYPSDQVTRDVAHVRLLHDLRVLLGPEWEWSYEVAVGLPPDRRHWDAVARHRVTGLVIRVEAETRLRDIQATLRKVGGKSATDPGRVLLAVRDTRSNRLAAAAATDILGSAFPASARRALAMLRAGQDPGADLLLMVDWARRGRD
jgi:transcriptional regulator with XRE-family HTH domain